MTRLHVLGSGSRGNCCAVSAGAEALLVDAGFSAREIERRAAGAGLDLGAVIGIIVTHEHGDHAQGAVRLAVRLGVPLLGSPGTLAALRGAGRVPRQVVLGGGAPQEIGAFQIHAAATSHDAAEPLALAVTAPGGVRIGYATDLGRPTTAVRWLFRQLTAIVLEANYDEVLLRTSEYPPVVQQRIAGFGGHLSNGDAAGLLSEIGHPGLQAVVLAHLSQRCNSPAHARERIVPALAAFGFAGHLDVAEQDHPLAPIPLRPPVAIPHEAPRPAVLLPAE